MGFVMGDEIRHETPEDLIARWRTRATSLEVEGDHKAAYHLRFAADELHTVLSAHPT